MKARVLDVLIWVFLYGGLFAACLGLAAERSGATTLGPTLMGSGLIAVAVGVGLLFIRSRVHD